MKISKRGIDELIKPHEGYLAKQTDGSCKAYICPAGKVTCGWGCTEDVDLHTHWTLFEAEAALQREMEKHEQNVKRLVKVPLNQCQFDALTSLCYNIGDGNLGKSNLLKHLNAGDYARAASHFADFKYARVRGATATRMKVKPGTSVVLAGLVERRANEAAMFLESDPVLDAMPQAVEGPRLKMDAVAIGTKVVPAAGAVGVIVKEVAATITEAIPAGVPAIPEVATKSMENFSAWKTFGKSFLDVGKEGLGALMLVGKLWPIVLVAGVAGGGLALIALRKRGQNGQVG